MSVLLALEDKAIARLWAALALSGVAAELFAVAVLWLAAARTPELVALLPGVWAVVLLAATLGGERLARGIGLRRVLVVAILAEGAAMLLPAVAGVAAMWPLLLSVAAVACARAQADPTIQAALPRLAVEPLALLRANGLIDGTHRLARLVGPALVPALLLVVPLEGLAPVAAAIAIAAALVLRGLPPLGVQRAAPGTSAGLRAASRAVRAHPALPVMLALSTATNLLWVLGPVLGWTLMLKDAVGAEAGPGLYGLMIAAYSITNLAANLAVASRPVPPSFTLAYGLLLLYGLGTTGSGILVSLGADAWPALLLAAAVAGAGAPAKDLLLAVRMQRDLPVDLVGPAFRLRTALALAGWLAGSIAAPLLLAAMAPAALVAVSGLGALVTAALGILLLGGRRGADA